MIKKNIKNNTGFVILFAVTLAALLLGIALGVGEIAEKEIKFRTSATATNHAFFAADTGIECALANNKSGDTAFTDGGPGTIACLGGPIALQGSSSPWSSSTAPRPLRSCRAPPGSRFRTSARRSPSSNGTAP